MRLRATRLGAVSRGAGSRAWSPLALFAAGEVGAWYDPSDLSTLFQDSAGTTPVTAPGQPVGLMLDKSGRGNHARQTKSTARPLLQQDGASGLGYLSYDGVDDFLVTGAINMTGSNRLTLVVGLRKLSDSTRGMIAEFSATAASNVGVFYLDSRQTSAEFSYGADSGSPLVRTDAFAAPSTHVLSVQNDRTQSSAASEIVIRRNGAATTNTVVNAGDKAGNFGSFPFYIGMRGGASLPFNGRMYGLILRGAASSAAEVAAAEAWINQRTGAY